MSRSEPQNTGRMQFTMSGRLGAGAFGEVYRARMRTPGGIEQVVAVKLLNEDLDPRGQPVARLRDEGRLLAALNHPVILRVYDLAVLDGRVSLVTEYVEGADLDWCIYDTPSGVPLRAALEGLAEVADALDAAFRARSPDGSPMKLVHRDIKPANIRITPRGTVKLLDFGIAKAHDPSRETRQTRNLTVMGTPAYLSPEVLNFDVTEAHTARDVFSLGCTLYECIRREAFFTDLDYGEIVRIARRPSTYADWLEDRLRLLQGLPESILGLLRDTLSYDHESRPTPGDLYLRCRSLAESEASDPLWTWCRQQAWPTGALEKGRLTGRSITDATLASALAAEEAYDAAQRGSALETLAPIPLVTPPAPKGTQLVQPDLPDPGSAAGGNQTFPDPTELEDDPPAAPVPARPSTPLAPPEPPTPRTIVPNLGSAPPAPIHVPATASPMVGVPIDDDVDYEPRRGPPIVPLVAAGVTLLALAVGIGGYALSQMNASSEEVPIVDVAPAPSTPVAPVQEPEPTPEIAEDAPTTEEADAEGVAEVVEEAPELPPATPPPAPVAKVQPPTSRPTPQPTTRATPPVAPAASAPEVRVQAAPTPADEPIRLVATPRIEPATQPSLDVPPEPKPVVLPSAPPPPPPPAIPLGKVEVSRLGEVETVIVQAGRTLKIAGERTVPAGRAELHVRFPSEEKLHKVLEFDVPANGTVRITCNGNLFACRMQ